MKNIKEKAVYRVGIDASKNYQRKGGKKFVKKKVALLLIACMVVSSLGLTFGANASDIENHWAKETIKTWISNDFIRGYPDGSFRPNNPITRAEFMVLVNKAFGFTERAEISYKDVSEGEWYYSTVARAVAAGYIGGYTDGSMKPNHPISRQEVTVVLSKITNAPQNPSAIDSFTDASAIANWAKGYVGAAAAKGYMGGYPDGSFKPTNNITRAEAVVTLNKALTAEVDKEEQEIVYDEAGTYGPQTGTTTITKDVIIKADGVTLQNMVIEGSLTIAEEVGDGEVYLNNVTVKGETFIRGGGKDSIYINGGQYNKITVQKTSSGNIRIVAINAAGLEIIISEAAAGEAIILEGSFDSITIEADDVNIVTQGETNIEEVVVKEGVSGTLVSLGNDTTITKLVADARIEVEGEGTIKEASGKEVRNTIFEKAPERIILPTSGRERSSSRAVTAIKISPAQVTASYDFNQTFTLTIENHTVTQAVYTEDITLGGVFTGLNLGDVDRINHSTVTAAVYGRLTSGGIGTITLDKKALVNSVNSLKANVIVNELEMKVSPAQVIPDNNFGQIFTLTLEKDTVTEAVCREHISLGGVFKGLSLGDVDRINHSTVTAAVYGSLTSTGIGTISLDKDALVNSTKSLEVDVMVYKGIVTEAILLFDQMIGSLITPVIITPEGVTAGATVAYQWQYQIGGEGDWIDINGATLGLYIIEDPVAIGDKLRVVVTGIGYYTGTVESNSVTIVEEESHSCPFVYSYNGDKFHFEHEAIPFAVNRALETTSYGTLRHLRAVDDKYYVRIVEELEEKSFVNDFQLIAVDYPADEGIQEVMADIYGNPHTIKNRIAPIEFIDSSGTSRLEEVTKEGELVGSKGNIVDTGKYVETYDVTFNKPQDIGNEAKLMIATQKTGLINQLGSFIIDKIDGTNNMWWIESVLETPSYKDKLLDFVSLVNLRVELWDGDEWVKQGEIKAGMHLLEEFLVLLDLSAIKDPASEIKVRLSSGFGFYEIHQIAIDYSENHITSIIELEPETAVFNGEEDVKSIIGEFDNDNRLRMVNGDIIEFVYNAPELDENHQRGFIVGLKGYYYIDPYTIENPLAKEWEGKDALEIIQEALDVTPDAVHAMPGLNWLMDLMESTYEAPLEEKIKTFFIENIL